VRKPSAASGNGLGQISNFGHNNFGTTMKKAILLLSLAAALAALPGAQAQLSCSPAPCVTANVQVNASEPASTVAGMVLAANPVAASPELAITANDLVNMSYCYGSLGDSSESGVFLSADQGLTWTGGCQLPSGTDMGPQYDSISGYDASGNLFSGQLGATTAAETVFLEELPAGAAIWGDFFPTLAYTDRLTQDFYDFDFPGFAIDNNASPPCLYLTAFEEGMNKTTHDPVTAVAVGTSCNDGVTWTTKRVSAVRIVPTVVAYPRVSVANDHTVLETWTQMGTGNTAKIYASSSSDFGGTWSTPVNILEVSMPAAASCTNVPHVDRALPRTCVRMFYFLQPASSYNSSTGTQAYEAVFPNYNGANVAVNYSSSSDGVTWSAPVALSPVTADQFEPCIAVNPSNTQAIGVAWLDTRNSPAGAPNTLYDAYGMTSADGGATWSAATRLSAASGGTEVETEPASQYLGDWTGCAWSNAIFYYAFPSTANGTNQVATIVGLNPGLNP
jgi:hypothetical protein